MNSQTDKAIEVEIKEILFGALLKNSDGDRLKTLTTDTRLADLQMDSLKLVEVIYELETEFGVEASEESLMNVVTLQDIVELFKYERNCRDSYKTNSSISVRAG